MAAIQEMKGEMEWKSRIFRQGDYNSEGENSSKSKLQWYRKGGAYTPPNTVIVGEGMHQTQFDIDYGKRPRGATQTKLPNQTDRWAIDTACGIYIELAVGNFQFWFGQLPAHNLV